MKHITKRLNVPHRKWLIALLCVPMFVFLNGCSDDPDADPYLNLGYYDDAAREVYAPIQGINSNAIQYSVYSNSHWSLQVQYFYDDELEWVDVWPLSGKGDGKFRLKVNENEDTPYVRKAEVYIIIDGIPTDTIKVTQDPVAPRLELDMEGMTKLAFRSYNSVREARLNTNVVWTAEITGNGDTSWVDFDESSETTQSFEVQQNTGTDPREATVIFRSKGLSEELTTTLTILQRDTSGDPENAVPKTISEILTQTGGAGEIDGNVYVEGYVISDLSTRNLNVLRSYDITDAKGKFDAKTDYERRLMYLMDDSNQGLMMEFIGATMNLYPLGAKVKVHLIDQTILVDQFSGGLKIGNIDHDAIIDWADEQYMIPPVQLNDFTRLDDYENCLVRIDPVQFALPFGTYFNVDERQVNLQLSVANLYSCIDFVETPRQYGHILVDGQGNGVKLMTDCTFTERFIRSIPRGSGPITAIVTKAKVWDDQAKVYNVVNQLRIRSDADNEVSPNESTRFTRPVVRFGPLVREIEELPQIVDDIQGVQLKTSVYTRLGSGMIYWSYAYGRIDPDRIIIDPDTGEQTPETPLNDDTYMPDFVYACFNANQFYRSSIGTTIPDADGEAWIISFSTLGVTGDLWLAFNNSSSQSGPGSLDAEWSTDEYTPVAQWQPLGRTYAPNWDSNYHLNQFLIKLPDEMKNLPKVVIRHRVVENRRSRRNGQTVSTAGTNRIGMWWVEEKI